MESSYAQTLYNVKILNYAAQRWLEELRVVVPLAVELLEEENLEHVNAELFADDLDKWGDGDLGNTLTGIDDDLDVAWTTFEVLENKEALRDILCHAIKPPQEYTESSTPTGEIFTLAEMLWYVGVTYTARHGTGSSPRRAMAALQFLISFPRVAAFAARRLTREAKTVFSTGRAMERASHLRWLLVWPAYCMPDDRQECEHFGSLQSLPIGDRPRSRYRFARELQDVPDFPAIVLFCGNEIPLGREADAFMSSCAQCNATIFRAIIKQLPDKTIFFEWLGQIVRLNMLRVHTPGMHSWEVEMNSASSPFLVGLAHSMLQMCAFDLQNRFNREKCNAFDVRYFSEATHASHDCHRLVLFTRKGSSDAKEGDHDGNDLRQTGSSELFFLISWLLLVVHGVVASTIGHLDALGNDIIAEAQNCYEDGTLELNRVELHSVVPAAAGLDILFARGSLNELVSTFVTLQFDWLAEVVKSGDYIEMIPEWLPCSALSWAGLQPPSVSSMLPLRWDLQTSSPPPISVSLVETALKTSTMLVTMGMRPDSDLQISPTILSSVLTFLCNLVSGIGSFAFPLYAPIVLLRPVATSPAICRLLVDIFVGLDVFQGVDVDQVRFDKYEEKEKIAEVLDNILSLDYSGDCAASLALLDKESLGSFFRSQIEAIAFVLEDACQKFSDATSMATDVDFVSVQLSMGVSNLAHAKVLVQLLVVLTKCNVLTSESLRTDRDTAERVAAWVVHFIHRLTSRDGTTSPEFCMYSCLRFKEFSGMSPGESDMIRIARRFATDVLGLNIASICTTIFALCTRWSPANSSARTHMFVISLVTHPDFDGRHFEKVFGRMVCQGDDDSGMSNDGYYTELNAEEGLLIDTMKLDFQKLDGIHYDETNDPLNYDDVELLADEQAMQCFVDQVVTLHKLETQMMNLDKAKIAEQYEHICLLDCAEDGMNAYVRSLHEWKVSSTSFFRAGSAAAGARADCSHSFANIACSQSVLTNGKPLQNEARKCYKGLPDAHPDGSCFVVYAEERMDLARGLITGPADTPYMCGLFAFDVYFPPTYPDVPPMVNFTTTGGGQIRFNPNLYQDGKVCLSVLNSWHSDDPSQKWNPQVSSLAQVLLSIQTQILVAEPYFNEPGYDHLCGTTDGAGRSRDYNMQIRLATLRYAVVGYLKRPPLGFEDVAERHFGMCRRRLAMQAKSWMNEAEATSYHARFQRTLAELLPLLNMERLAAYPALDGSETVAPLPVVPIEADAVVSVEDEDDDAYYDAGSYDYDDQYDGYGGYY